MLFSEAGACFLLLGLVPSPSYSEGETAAARKGDGCGMPLLLPPLGRELIGNEDDSVKNHLQFLSTTTDEIGGGVRLRIFMERTPAH